MMLTKRLDRVRGEKPSPRWRIRRRVKEIEMDRAGHKNSTPKVLFTRKFEVASS